MNAGNSSRRREVRSELSEAAQDYRWLLDRGYPDQPALKLVGDHYQLTGVERAMLFRGVFSERDSVRRRDMLIRSTDWLASDDSQESDPRFDHLLIDGHNVLFTISNYLAGRPVVLGTDAFIRDIGGTQTRLPRDERFTRIADVLCRTLAASRFRNVTILLDSPLPWSREHRGLILDRRQHIIEENNFEIEPARRRGLEIVLEEHVDRTVAATRDSVIATSDTGILNRCRAPVVDIGGTIVHERFNATLVELLPDYR